MLTTMPTCLQQNMQMFDLLSSADTSELTNIGTTLQSQLNQLTCYMDMWTQDICIYMQKQ